MAVSALSRLLEWSVAGTAARANVWDLAGLTGLHEDLALDFSRHQMHTLPLCLYAKSTHRGWRRCIRCKAAATHAALRRGAFTGTCHMGLTEVVVPVVHQGEIVAALFAGQVRSGAGRRAASPERRAARTGLDAARLAELDRETPRVTPDELREIADRLDVARRFILAHVRASRGRLAPRDALQRPAVEEIGSLRGRPRRRWLARRGMDIARAEYPKPLQTARVAVRLGAPLAVFCRAFKEETGGTFKAYLLRVRLEAARRLLAAGRHSATWTALETGFRSPAYFSRAFSAAFGLSPREVRLQRWRRGDAGNRQSGARNR